MKDMSISAHEALHRFDLPQGDVASAAFRPVIEAGLDVLRRSRPENVGAIEAVWSTKAASLARMDSLVDLACDALAGSTEALDDVRDELNKLVARTPQTTARALALGAIPARKLDGAAYYRDILSRLEARRPATVPEDRLVLPVDALMALAASAILAGGDDIHLSHRYLGALALQLGRLMRLSSALRKVELALAAGHARVDREISVLADKMERLDDIDPGDAAEWPPLPGLMGIPDRLEDALVWEIISRAGLLLTPLGKLEYQIMTISNQHACPREQIVITGDGFEEAGTVLFTAIGGGVSEVSADEWGPQRIVVTVPKDATAGILSLRISVDAGFAWNGHHYGRILYKHARKSATFLGGRTHFLFLGCVPTGGGSVVAPGSNCSVTWSVANAARVEIVVRTQEDGVLLETQSASARGSRALALPAWTSTRHLHIEAKATGPCGEVSQQRDSIVRRPYALSIQGMEITQAIQRYRSKEHLTDPADCGGDNTLRLVTDKAAWMRVYLRSGQDASFEGGRLPDVTGKLLVERRVGGVWILVDTLSAMNGPIAAEDTFPSYAAERGDLQSTLNFFVPANVMTGHLRFTAEVFSPYATAGGAAQRALEVDVSLSQTLQIAAIAVGYDGNDTATPPQHVTFAAPTNAVIANQAGYALAIWPVSETPRIRTIATLNATHALDGHVPPGGCDPNWDSILHRVQEARTNDGNQSGWLYYGFVTDRIPMTHGNVGCSGGTAAGLIGATGTTMTHELGHQLGLPHAPCGRVGSANAAYPLYEPYDAGITTTDASGATEWYDASIGEYGLDVNTGDLYSPAVAEDFMSYGGPPWISLYSHAYMLQHAGLNPTVSSTSGASLFSNTKLPLPMILTVLGRIERDGTVHVGSVSRVAARIPLAEGRRTKLFAEILDDSGRVLSSAPLFALPRESPRAAPCPCCASSPEQEPCAPYLFRAVLLDASHAAELRVRRGDDVIWRRQRPERAAVFKKAAAHRRRGGDIEVSWSLEAPKDMSQENVWLRWSADGGKTWNGLAVGLSGGKTQVDPRLIPAQRVMFELLAHDGFHTISTRTGQIDLPARPASVAITHPRQGTSFPPNRPLRLRGVVLDPGTTDHAPKEAKWILDGKPIGEGLDVWIPAPPPGEHTLELTLRGAEPTRLSFMVDRKNEA